MISKGIKRSVRALLLALTLFLVALAGANWWLLTLTEPLVHQQLETVPVMPVAIVFGTSRYLSGGGLNPYYRNRIDAAARLYRTGRVRHILLSGDNAHRSYNEPRRMYQDLVRAGVPASALTLDFAGFSTLDTLMRAQAVFGLDRAILVTQGWHLPRALYIARVIGLEAEGYAAASTGDWPSGLKLRGREALARLATLGDLYLWRREPRFLGRPEPIAAPAETHEAAAAEL